MRKLFFLIIALWGSQSPSLQAATPQTGPYAGREDVGQFIIDMQEKHGYDSTQLLAWIEASDSQSQLFELMNRPAEKLHWYKYRKIFLTQERVDAGVKFWQENQALLGQLEQQYQVPAEILVAIVGVETYYGRIKGKSPVFDTLMTFAFDYPKRARFFKKELEQFLLLTREQQLPPLKLVGSYAGAMGMPQFISSSYRSYAVDGDGDGKVDLWDSLPDVLASVANYFVKHGWQPEEPIAYPLRSEKPDTALKTGYKLQHSYAELQQNGFSAKADLSAFDPLGLIALEQTDGTDYWAGLKNFYVITRYNHSELYAMAVFQLSQAIRQKVS